MISISFPLLWTAAKSFLIQCRPRYCPEELLRRLPPEALVVELASAPGGCDAAVAEAMGLRYRNAPGLPGKAAPRTAGEYLGQVIRGLPHWEE